MIPNLTYPWALLLLVLLPPLVWRYGRGSRGVWQFSDRRLLPALPSWRARLSWWGGLALRVAVLLLATFALAGPRWEKHSPIETEGISIAMIVDVSVSMGEEDFAWQDKKITRLFGVKELFRLFVAGGQTPDGADLKGRPNDLIALVAFATHPETACPLTLDHKALLQILDTQEPRVGPDEGTTNIGDALAWGLHVLQDAPTRRKVIVLLTDGGSNVKKTLQPIQSAHLAANLSIPIYAIDASPEPKNKEEAEQTEQDRVTMQKLAKMTHGTYFRAQDGKGLFEAYESIDRLERERIQSFQYRRYYEGFHWFVLAALVSCLTLIALEATIWRKVP